MSAGCLVGCTASHRTVVGISLSVGVKPGDAVQPPKLVCKVPA